MVRRNPPSRGAVLEGESVGVPKLLPSGQIDTVAQKLPTCQHSAT